MRRFRGGPTGRRGPGAVQYFDYGPLQFNINRALLLAANRNKYRPETRQPSSDWIGPYIEMDEAHVNRCGHGRPVLFATFPLPGHPQQLLIDGNHRVAHALKHHQSVRAVVLDLEDTLRVLTGPEELIRQIKQEGEKAGLLRSVVASDAVSGSLPGEEPQPGRISAG